VGSHDPKAAAKYALISSREHARRVGCDDHRALVQAGSKAALAWIDTLQDTQPQRNATSGLLQEWVQTDPQGALRRMCSAAATASNSETLFRDLSSSGESGSGERTGTPGPCRQAGSEDPPGPRAATMGAEGSQAAMVV
jgi:hypothetical protein